MSDVDVPETLRKFEAANKLLEVRIDADGDVMVVARLRPALKIDSDPGVWGVILADVFNHIGRAYVDLMRHSPGTPTPTTNDVARRILEVLTKEIHELDDNTEGCTVSVGKAEDDAN